MRSVIQELQLNSEGYIPKRLMHGFAVVYQILPNIRAFWKLL